MELLDLKGLGKKSLLNLNKLGIYTIDDLLMYYPYRYEVLKPNDLNTALQDEKVIVSGTVEIMPTLIRFRGNMNKMTFRIFTGDMIVKVAIYNRGFLKHNFEIGKDVTVIGKYDLKNNLIVASDIRFSRIEETKIEGVYSTTSGLSKKSILIYINEALKYVDNIIDYIPSYFSEKYKFMDKLSAIKIIHNPNNIDELKQAQIRLKYEELFIFMLKINFLKMQREKKENAKIIRNVNKEWILKKVDEFIKSLPFELTKDQKTAVDDIINDILSEKRMNRMIQGDVGSGKTIVGAIACFVNYLSGYMSAFMAPTEILARQHYDNFSNMFSKFGLNVEVLLGSTSKKDKKDIYDKLKNGEIDIIIGTHALIQDNVEYKNLGLVITDEQHRFGVNQRANLKNKGIMVDVLYMSATPIPRTYALTIYGDMDISNIKTRPSGRREIITDIRSNKEITDVLKLIKHELDNGHQTYIIAPLIDNEEEELNNVNLLYKKFQMAFDKYKVGILHGKLSNDEKDEVMNQFSLNKINILISTTVVEVGVDVSNATVIVIFEANRFGLSQLHQLRGRVGRSELQSYCILISDEVSKRLEVMTKTCDGFKISEEDFKLRGSGDLFGIRQSGDMKFKIADIKNDFKILLQTKEDVNYSIDKFDIINDYKYENILSSISQLD